MPKKFFPYTVEFSEYEELSELKFNFEQLERRLKSGQAMADVSWAASTW